MRKFLLIFLGLFVSTNLSSGQNAAAGSSDSSKYQWLTQDSWLFGFGLTYPKYVSTSVSVTKEAGYGGYLSIQKNFSEHIGLRLKTSYIHLEGESGSNTISNNLVVADLDLVYYFIPCEPITPYVGGGFGFFYSIIENSPTDPLNASSLDYELNLVFGAEWRLGQFWNLKTELGYHTAASSKFDGTYGTTGGGIIGGTFDSYLDFDAGVVYYFARGDRSNICEIYDGISAKVDYDRIEEIVRRYAVPPAEPVDYERIEDIVVRNKSSISAVPSNWVLLGVNFEFDRATLRPESLPILYNVAEILLTNPDIKVEIQGHTDDKGLDLYNERLSLARAQVVKNFLVAKGISPDRLIAVGMGESQPIMDNSTPEGRDLNRRIEFRVIR